LGITSFERQLIEKKYDYVYFISPDIRVMTITKLKIISTIWDFGHLDLNKDKEFRNSLTQIKRKYYYNKSINSSEVVIVESLTTKNMTMKLYDKKAKDILILSFSTIMMNYKKVFDDFIPKAKPQSSYFVYPANYWPHKNHLAIIKMVKCLKNKDIKIYFVGSKTKYISSFQKKISQFDCSDVIIELGRIEQKSLLSLIANSLGVLMPSKLGPTNLPVFESLFLGVPVIVSLAHERIKETEKVIRYIDVNDPEVFAFEIDMLPSIKFDRTDLLVEFEKNSKVETHNLIRRLNM
jgi:glycosyltransferase involved in cell wall biosynthesis